MFKIIVIGNSAVGKTSIVNRFVGDRFDHNYKATIAADFQVKILNIQGNEIRLQIWDLVGMDTTFAGINRSFCRNASGAILVGDITDAGTIEATAEWKQQVEEIVAVSDTPIPMILAVNKVDICDEMETNGESIEPWQTQENLDDFALNEGFIGAVRVSAKTDTNIAELFSQLVRQMLIKEISEQQLEDEYSKTENNGVDLERERIKAFQLNQSKKNPYQQAQKQDEGCKC